MKRTLALILSLILILAAVPAMGEDTWQQAFSTLSDADLEAMSAAIHAEMVRRKGEPFTLSPGIYIVGQDIPAGSYTVEALDGVFGYFYAYSDYTDLSFSFYDAMIAPDTEGVATKIGRIYLADWYCIKITMTCKMIPFEGV